MKHFTGSIGPKTSDYSLMLSWNMSSDLAELIKHDVGIMSLRKPQFFWDLLHFDANDGCRMMVHPGGRYPLSHNSSVSTSTMHTEVEERKWPAEEPEFKEEWVSFLLTTTVHNHFGIPSSTVIPKLLN
jgi:hypothetical protein